MKRIETRIGDDTYEQILASGHTVYSFVQNAILEKVDRQKKQNEIDAIQKNMTDVVLKKFENQVSKAVEEMAEIALQQIKISRTLIDEYLEKDQDFRQKLNGALQSIYDAVNKK